MGGRATFTGTTFQAKVGAVIAGLLLTERPLARLGEGLPGVPRKVWFEIPAAVDDLLVETTAGQVYVQAKHTISLSDRPEAELASVADQFVRQFQAGCLESGARRDLVANRDRLVLAVSSEAAATITENLRQALDRARTKAATALPAKLQEALNDFTTQVDYAWQQVRGVAITAGERQQLLALCSVVVVAKDKRAVEEPLRDIVAVPGTETLLLDWLEKWAADAAATGTGGDAAAIRLLLGDKIALKELPSYAADVARLQAYSADTITHLARFTTIAVPEGILHLHRSVASPLAAAARQGSLVVTGEPGAGKSAILHDLAQELGREYPVCCLTVEAGVHSLAALQQEIGLAHPLLDVLQQVPGPRPAFLLLDALDASRGGVAEAVYKKLLTEVLALPGWHVVASVRSFDLRLGQAWQRLFRGAAPVAEYSKSDFAAVRHLHVDLLDATEQADLAHQSPGLAAALAAGGPGLQDLARNPFNLALLADLLSGGLAPTALAGISTRGQLLAAYWQARVTPLGRPALVGLVFLVQQLLHLRTLLLPEVLIADPAIGEVIDELESVGVLAQEAVRGAVGFRHQVLFDYAVARLALLPDAGAAKGHLRKEKAAGLLLAPSLTYWVEGLRATWSPRQFWDFIAPLVADQALDPLVRVEVTRLAVNTVRPGDDLAALADFFNGGTELATPSLRQFAGALLTKFAAGQLVAVGPWAHLLASLARPSPGQLGSQQVLLEELLRRDSDAAVLADLGWAARGLLAGLAGSEFLIHSFARSGIAHVAQTYATDPVASRQLLAQVLDPTRFAEFGYLEVPALAQQVRLLANHDPELVVQLYRRVFQPHDFRPDQTTTLVPSTILAMHSNAAQDFRLAAYELAEFFPDLLAARPEVGIRALAAALRGEWEKQEPQSETPPPQLAVSGGSFAFEDDSSAAWAWDLETSPEEYARLYQAFVRWLPDAADPGLLATLPHLLLGESGTALAWRVLFDVGAAQPAQVGVNLVPAAASTVALGSGSTRRSAIALLGAVYPHLSLTEREGLERQWLQPDFAAFKQAEVRSLVLGKLFTAVGEQHLATAGAHAQLAAAQAAGHALENDKLYAIHSREVSRLPDGEETEEGPLAGLIRTVRQAEQAARLGTAEAGHQLAEALHALEQASSQVADHPDDGVATVLVGGVRHLLTGQSAATSTYPAAVEQLLALTHHPSPPPTASAEEDFARAQVWSPAPRLEAAQALADLVGRPDLRPQLGPRFEQLLLHDPRPEVRFLVAPGLRPLATADEEAVWQLVEKLVDHELNPAVIEQAARSLQDLGNRQAARLEPFIVTCYHRLAATGRQSKVLLHWLVFFALDKGLPASAGLLHAWLADIAGHEQQLLHLLPQLRAYFALGYGSATPAQVAAGQRARQLIEALATAAEPGLRTFPTDGTTPTAEQALALKLFTELAGQLYFAVSHERLPVQLTAQATQRQFLADYAPLIARLAGLGPPAAVHYLLKMLKRFVAADPERCFDLLSEAILRPAGVAHYEYEAQGATQFVELITRYLADYRFVFAEETRQRKLMECLAVFVDVGWPEARRLFQNLPELLQ